MALELSDEQLLLEQSVRRFVDRDYSFEVRESLRGSALGFSEDNWRQFANLGWLAVALPGECGGLEGGAPEQALVCEVLGRAMVLEPYLSTAVLSATAIESCTDQERRRSLLEALGQGRSRVATAWAEPQSRFDLEHVATRAGSADGRWSLDGKKIAVLDAPSANAIVVSARTEGAVRDRAGIGLFLVQCDAPGLTLAAHDVMDGTRAADLTLSNTPGELLVQAPEGLAALERAVDTAIVARSAQAAGAMAASFEQTLEYVKTREQFGVPIGSFQALQHRLVDMWMAVRECQSMVRMSAAEIGTDDPRERAKVASAVKSFVGRRAGQMAKEIVQMHGGIGMTEELPIGHYFRCLTLFTTLFGSADYHLRRYAALSG